MQTRLLDHLHKNIISKEKYRFRMGFTTENAIKPLHKNEDRCEVSNYRPVSLLTSFSKIFETVIHRRILKHITNYNILSTEQYGFRLGLRPEYSTYKLTTEFLNAMNNKLLVGGIFVI